MCIPRYVGAFSRELNELSRVRCSSWVRALDRIGTKLLSRAAKSVRVRIDRRTDSCGWVTLSVSIRVKKVAQ
jgi:hypothetical protein